MRPEAHSAGQVCGPRPRAGLGLLGVGINDFLANVADNLPVIGGTP